MRIGRLERAWSAEALRPAVGWKVWRVENGLLVSVLYGDAWPVDEPVRHREEAVGLLFNVSDIVSTLVRIETLLGGDDGEEEDDEG